MSVRVKTLKVFIALKEGLKSLREISIHIGTSKSSVDRSLKAVERRNCHPESWLWETEEGQEWIRFLVLAVLIDFGINGGIGAEHISQFFKRSRLDKQFGASPTSIQTMIKRIESLFAIYQNEQEEKQRQTGKSREVIIGGDETFFARFMVLVLMDLPSGYLIMEEVATDRSYDTWKEKAKKRLEEIRLFAVHFVSDRAPALIKLAIEGLGCQAGADLFHGEYEITKWLGSAFSRQLGAAIKNIEKSKTLLTVLQGKANTIPENIQETEKEIEQHESVLKTIVSGKDSYKGILQKISTIVHPFSIEENGQQTSEQVENILNNQAQELKIIAGNNGISDSQGALEKFVRQIKDISGIVSAWWGWAEGSIATFGLEPFMINWLLFTLLPVVYWHKQMKITKNKRLKAVYRKAWEQALAEYHANPLTQRLSSVDVARWRAWAEWMTNKFQRTSSAVEGRNGCLSQMYHNGRGMTVRRLKALTVSHNFDRRRGDGTTAAERLFGMQFPDLFEWTVERMGELPLARKSRERVISNPLILQSVPA
ncbi:MAG: hypothetical protein HQL87_04725 [Magnetococcales bacterium]|nr:hypothetical protein [Magnetococcales bacterium]